MSLTCAAQEKGAIFRDHHLSPFINSKSKQNHINVGMEVLKQLTQTIIGSQVSYCSAIWGNAAISEIRVLQKARSKAAAVVLTFQGLCDAVLYGG